MATSEPQKTNRHDADFFVALEKQRTAATLARDLPTIERLHATDCELITPAGWWPAGGGHLEALLW